MILDLAAEDREFDTELMWNFETGIKGLWLDESLQAQVAIVLSAAGRYSD